MEHSTAVSGDHHSSESFCVTCTAPVNIAVIKYWGKRDEKLILPLNSSLSASLHQDDLRTLTTVFASKSLQEDELWLNGKKEDVSNPRVQSCLRELRARAGVRRGADGRAVEWAQYKLRIVSSNNFPTAAGLASSASGYCCLVFTLAQLYNVQGDLSIIARQGSGSACRSMYGGWVRWEAGVSPDGSDSLAVLVQPETHWPEMRIVVLVVNDQQKETSSRDGMQQSAATSQLLKRRVQAVPARLRRIEQAIAERDYDTFADITMLDSDEFHAVCADTQPPIRYMNAVSDRVVQLVNAFNRVSVRRRAAYTFDAGPNACIYLLERDLAAFVATVVHYFPPRDTTLDKFCANASLVQEATSLVPSESFRRDLPFEPQPGALKYILLTRPGPGPQLVPDHSKALVDPATGAIR